LAGVVGQELTRASWKDAWALAAVPRGSHHGRGRPTPDSTGTRRGPRWHRPPRRAPGRCRGRARRQCRRAPPRYGLSPGQAPELGGDLGELVGVLDAHGEEALASDRAAKRLGLAVEAGDPDRHAGSLDRPLQEPHRVDRVVLATMVDGLPGPSRLEDPERLVEHSRALAVVELLARDRVLAGELVAPEPDAQGEAPAAQPVKGSRSRVRPWRGGAARAA
jgi:hypothetical protein